MKIKTLPILALVAFVALASSASATVVISFNGTTANASTTSNVYAQIPANSGTGIKTATLSYSPTTAWTATPSFSGEAVYGGLSYTANRTADNPANMNIAVYRGSDTPEAFRFAAQQNSTNESFLLNSALLFAPSVSENYTFNGTSSLSVVHRLPGTYSTNEARWLVVAGGLTYVSSASFTMSVGPSSAYVNVSLSNPAAINWAAWTPGSDLSLGSLTFNTPGSTLTNITRAGIYSTFGQTTTSGSAPSLDITAFSADLVIIPEPTTWALLAGGLTALVIFRRRRVRCEG